MKNNIYVYEIFLDEELIANSGEEKFKTELSATEDAMKFIDNLLNTDPEYSDYVEDDFDINVSEIPEDDFVKGW